MASDAESFTGSINDILSNDDSQSDSSGSDSDSEVLLQSGALQLVADNLMAQELHDMLKTIQINHQLLSRKYKSLKIEHDNLEASRMPRATAGTGRGSLSGESKEISLAGGRFSVFLKQLSQERANSVHLVRSIAGQLLGLDPGIFSRTYDCSTVLALQALLKDPLKPNDWYPLFPRLQYPESNTQSTRPFQCEALATFLKLVLYGPSSIRGEVGGKHATKGMLWSVEKSTPGMIAMAATLVLYACSLDQSFSDKAKGPSGINWKERFTRYKQAILSFPPNYRNNLLSWYDQQIFAKTTASLCMGSLVPNLGEVEDLVEHLFQADVSHASNPPTGSSSSQGVLTPGQIGQPLEQMHTTDQANPEPQPPMAGDDSIEQSTEQPEPNVVEQPKQPSQAKGRARAKKGPRK
ncbi:hypothetical protein EI94DRAFT_1802179 [Lactarius quietus]|nr:hypothetical protein EI94DRAFT_1802179 [Lactarius quietus]